jgi:hypothetical protein
MCLSFATASRLAKVRGQSMWFSMQAVHGDLSMLARAHPPCRHARNGQGHHAGHVMHGEEKPGMHRCAQSYTDVKANFISNGAWYALQHFGACVLCIQSCQWHHGCLRPIPLHGACVESTHTEPFGPHLVHKPHPLSCSGMACAGGSMRAGRAHGPVLQHLLMHRAHQVSTSPCVQDHAAHSCCWAGGILKSIP